jgi:hypothetical protein
VHNFSPSLGGDNAQEFFSPKVKKPRLMSAVNNKFAKEGSGFNIEKVLSPVGCFRENKQ